MRAMMDEFLPDFAQRGWEAVLPPMVQTLGEDELERLLPEVDGWIAGDDPVTRRVLGAGQAGKLRAVVKWGVGVDNVDFQGASQLGMPVRNTPGVFGEEVADLALGYVIALARQTFQIDRGVRAGDWPKPQGMSLRGKTVALVGLGDIGRAAATRFAAVGMRIMAYDPFVTPNPEIAEHRTWPDGLEHADFIVLTCPLTTETHHMVNRDTLAQAPAGVYIVNVARGPLIDESALVDALTSGHAAGAALDVFEHEPPGKDAPIRQVDGTIYGSHNASNTVEGARRATTEAINHLHEMLLEVQA